MSNTDQTAKRRFNLVDLLLVIVILFGALLAAKFLLSERNGAQNVNVVFTLKIDEVDAADSGLLQPGFLMKTASSASPLGRVEKIEQIDAYRSVYQTQNDRFTSSAVPKKVTLYVNVLADCTFADGRLYCGENVIAAGETPDLLLPFEASRTIITAVTRR